MLWSSVPALRRLGQLLLKDRQVELVPLLAVEQQLFQLRDDARPATAAWKVPGEFPNREMTPRCVTVGLAMVPQENTMTCATFNATTLVPALRSLQSQQAEQHTLAEPCLMHSPDPGAGQ
jgi:hypothetical protein